MMEISQPTVKCVETNEDKSYGKYTIAPLERGFGTTLGNSLRRVLLSSLSGAAVTSIKIEKIKHEFSTVPGIIEDMTEIILNIKGIRAKLHNESNIVSISVAKGRTGELTAGDIVHGPEVEIMNPDHVIAHLNGSDDVFMEFTLSKGRGYNTAEQNKPAKQVIGVIPIDSIFTPVKKANYKQTTTALHSRFGQTALSMLTRLSLQQLTASSSTSSSLQLSLIPIQHPASRTSKRAASMIQSFPVLLKIWISQYVHTTVSREHRLTQLVIS